NRSGIISNAGPIGGVRQQGKWKINARYNKSSLIKRFERIAEYRHRIHVSNKDGIEFISELDNHNLFFFIDPPYYEKGPELYLNSLDHDYHERLSKSLRQMNRAAWVLTYDDCDAIRCMYQGWAEIRPFSLRYSAAKRRMGNEVMITPKGLSLPYTQSSLAVSW
ncbi:MAG: DNA adenine methylase, partial [Phycisphaerales bacterium JB065]